MSFDHRDQTEHRYDKVPFINVIYPLLIQLKRGSLPFTVLLCVI